MEKQRRRGATCQGARSRAKALRKRPACEHCNRSVTARQMLALRTARVLVQFIFATASARPQPRVGNHFVQNVDRHDGQLVQHRIEAAILAQRRRGGFRSRMRRSCALPCRRAMASKPSGASSLADAARRSLPRRPRSSKGGFARLVFLRCHVDRDHRFGDHLPTSCSTSVGARVSIAGIDSGSVSCRAAAPFINLRESRAGSGSVTDFQGGGQS